MKPKRGKKQEDLEDKLHTILTLYSLWVLHSHHDDLHPRPKSQMFGNKAVEEIIKLFGKERP